MVVVYLVYAICAWLPRPVVFAQYLTRIGIMANAPSHSSMIGEAEYAMATGAEMQSSYLLGLSQ